MNQAILVLERNGPAEGRPLVDSITALRIADMKEPRPPSAGVPWDQRHLMRALLEFEAFYNHHRPHQGIANARPLRPLPSPITDPDQMARLDIRRRQWLGGILNEYEHAA